MGFVCERITEYEDIKYFENIGFTDITGRKIKDPYIWSIDRENDMVLIPRGGGGLEMPEGYALYLDGKIIEMEGREYLDGNKLNNDLKIHWIISNIKVPNEIFQEKDDMNLGQIIEEAFIAYSYRIRKPSQVLMITVDINV